MDAIFIHLANIHKQARRHKSVLRLSMDAKAITSMGPLSWISHSHAASQTFKPAETRTPFGIFLPANDEQYLYFASSDLTADFIADNPPVCCKLVHASFPDLSTFLVNLDNGPENHSGLTQFMQRLINSVEAFRVSLQLACYSLYHSQYNPRERVSGVPEQYWNGTLLDSSHVILRDASTMTYNTVPGIITVNSASYPHSPNERCAVVGSNWVNGSTSNDRSISREAFNSHSLVMKFIDRANRTGVRLSSTAVAALGACV